MSARACRASRPRARGARRVCSVVGRPDSTVDAVGLIIKMVVLLGDASSALHSVEAKVSAALSVRAPPLTQRR